MSSYRRTWIVIGIVAVATLLFSIAFMPITAQDTPPAFATNTPQLTPATALLTFATNTPQPTVSSAALPDAPIDRYALRLWDEASLVRVILDQVNQLQAGEADRQMGIRLLQNELQVRFPGAPHDPVLREEVLQAMLKAPRGSVDMRFVVWPTIQDALNQRKPSFETSSTLNLEDFTVTITPANIDNTGRMDAALAIQYPATSDVALYKGYVLATIDKIGTYRILPSNYPAIPFNGFDLLNLEQVGDLNGDGLDEMAVSVDHPGDDNGEMMIFGWRGTQVINLIEPGQQVHFLDKIKWDFQAHSFTAQEFQTESRAWQCFSERDVPWTWTLNFFRPPPQLDKFVTQNSLGCLLYGAEPLFEQPPSQAINAIEQVAPFVTQDDTYASQRATMIVIMLHVLNGDVAQATDQVKQLQAVAQPGSWLAEQTNAFMQIASQPGVTPLQICAALQNASEDGACDVNQVLARLFKEQPLRRDEPIESQVTPLGLSVLDQTTVSTVGRLDRQVVHFDLAGDQWWAFAPLEADVYTAERTEVPPGYETAQAPTLLITPPQKAYDVLLQDNNAEETLNILDNVVRDNPGTKLDGSARFLQAISYDLLADRSHARESYFDLWASDPTSIWGQLAAAHLERR